MKKTTKKDLLTPIKLTKTRIRSAKTTLTNKISKIRQISLYTTFKRLIDSLGIFIFKALYLDRLNKTALYFLTVISNFALKLGIYTHVLLALLIYLAQQLDMDLKLNWGVYLYVFIYISNFFSSIFSSISSWLVETLKSFLKLFITNINEVKEAVETKNNVTSSAKEAYKTYKENDKVKDILPDQRSWFDWQTTFYIVGCAFLFTFTVFAIYHNWDVLTNIEYRQALSDVKNKIVDIWNSLFYGGNDDRGGAGLPNLTRSDATAGIPNPPSVPTPPVDPVLPPTPPVEPTIPSDGRVSPASTASIQITEVEKAKDAIPATTFGGDGSEVTPTPSGTATPTPSGMTTPKAQIPLETQTPFDNTPSDSVAPVQPGASPYGPTLSGSQPSSSSESLASQSTLNDNSGISTGIDSAKKGKGSIKGLFKNNK